MLHYPKVSEEIKGQKSVSLISTQIYITGLMIERKTEHKKILL